MTSKTCSIHDNVGTHKLSVSIAISFSHAAGDHIATAHAFPHGVHHLETENFIHLTAAQSYEGNPRWSSLQEIFAAEAKFVLVRGLNSWRRACEDHNS